MHLHPTSKGADVWTPGTRIGPYELVSPIGAGGMGEVWKARDTRLNRTVAIKRLAEKHSARFEQEARAIAALNHPHICTLYDIGPDYLVMEFLEGQPLQGPLPMEDALRAALEIARALEAAHAKGILHRDLKPGNILATAAGAKLLDFGLAKLVHEEPQDTTKTIEGTVAGTAAYMSPEQAQGQPVDARTDIFSFGAVLYELLGGRRAFTGGSTTEILSAVLRDEPRTLDAPAGLTRIIRKCLRKPREERYASMSEVRAALEQVKLDAKDQPSIAVLPFANLSRDPDDEYFSDGLADEIISALAKVPGLKVIARTSAFAFKGQNTDIRRIAEILGVTSVLEGSVRRAGSRVRVTVQLNTAADGTNLWSERYDREMSDIFAVQDEIAAAIASELKLKFAPHPAARPRHQPNLRAYEAYLRYRQYQWEFTPESLRRSRECLEQAIALDPDFALPYVGLADHQGALTLAGVPGHEVFPRARELARRAWELDPDLPEANGYLGVMAGLYDFDWNESERWFRAAMAREPVPWHVRAWYSCFFLLSLGRLEESRREAERALQDNPLGQIIYWNLGATLNALGLEEETRQALTKVVELDPNFWYGWVGIGIYHALNGRPAEAWEYAERAFARLSTSPYVIGLKAGLLRNSGERERSQEVLATLPAGLYGNPVARSCYHLIAGEIDDAVVAATEGIKERHIEFIANFVRPYQRIFRQSSRWPDLLKSANLPDGT